MQTYCQDSHSRRSLQLLRMQLHHACKQEPSRPGVVTYSHVSKRRCTPACSRHCKSVALHLDAQKWVSCANMLSDFYPTQKFSAAVQSSKHDLYPTHRHARSRQGATPTQRPSAADQSSKHDFCPTQRHARSRQGATPTHRPSIADQSSKDDFCPTHRHARSRQGATPTQRPSAADQSSKDDLYPTHRHARSRQGATPTLRPSAAVQVFPRNAGK
eukprot:1137474-Pelagomonas_calceolata.AAC.7